MKLNELIPPRGHRTRKKRVGRGIGSGQGKTSGRGHKGQMSRTGSGHKPGFEGGQMPLIRRIPKRGFSNTIFSTDYQIVNVESLAKCSQEKIITPEILCKNNLIDDSSKKVKILGNGEIKKALTIKAHAFSESAIKKIQNAGGNIELIKG